ncbi:PREDICTED: N-(5-amino-5-carboxypentanoyl)-L-cysteinyl-D-valine synthase isoform X1 [Acromyrmex echinatior]|uniref:Tyrocidine synthetase 3 n=1 Tax=Acromyrmex echinatior TaxID=103372 RepID=F4WQJ6_ACREC|nr:PREDICTED: N-(5-amino-5-carboxypentanoyl)-L-cysteinyl-D-valine synthase isoform X1 [Acromyrmex echinatior]EGI63523.1 Tyrocidine synthetase 3 [Acromyrmex echinatior]
MGTLQQQSILQGQHTGRNQKKDLVHELFSHAAKSHPNQIAIYYEDDTGQEYKLSFKELDNITNQLARALQKYEKFETTSQSLIAVCMKPSHRLPTVLLSILKAGMAYLPLDAEFPMSRVKHILEEAKPLIVLIEEGADLSIYEGALIVTYEKLLKDTRQEQENALQTKEGSNQLAIVLYTSGSTGVPKGVLIPHTTLLNRLQWQWREFPYADDEERCVFKTSLTFVDSVPEIWGPLLQSRTLVIVPKNITKDPEKFIPLLEKHQIQRLVLVPSLLRSLLMYLDLQDNNNNVLGCLKLWICSGETLSVALADQFFATFDNKDKILANFYGSTEVMGDVTYYLLNKRAQLQGMKKVPIGKPIDNCIIYLVNKDMRLVPQGEVGELIVAGRNLAVGYIRKRDTHKFLDNPYAIDPEYSRIFRTGDYAKIVKESIIYEGRVDSQIKIRGHRVDLTEVEKVVARISNIDKVVVLCHKPGELSQALVAFVTIMNGTNLSSSEIEDFLQRTLPSYMLPQIFIVDHIPLLTNGKTDRQTLLKKYESSYFNNEDDFSTNCDYSGVPSQDLAKAHILFPTIASVIGRSDRVLVTLHSNFYELGGNSLNSIYTVTKLRDQGYQIGITDFITAKNLADVLNRMKLMSSDEEPLKEAIDQKPYVFESLNDCHKEDTIKIITESFYSKADLEQWLIPDITRGDYRELMEIMWEFYVEKDLSFVIKSAQSGKIIGVALNFDLWDEPAVVLKSKLMIIFDFLESVEGPIRDKLPKNKGQIIHISMMGTNIDLSPAENVLVMKHMEEYCLQFAKQKEYIGIFTTNTSPLTQQLGTDVLGYETMQIYQVNKYETPEGYKPFGKAPDNQVIICALKMIN